MGPGARAFTLIPYRPHSTARDIVIACTAALAIADGTTNADPDHTHVVRFDSTEPGWPAAIQRFPMATVVLNEPVITVDVTASKARWLSVAVGAMKLAAALLSSPVSGPCRSQISLTAASTPAESPPAARCETPHADGLIMRPSRAAARDFFSRFREHRLAPPPQMHLGPVSGQVRRHAPTQAGTAAGDQDLLVRQQVGREDVALRCAHGRGPFSPAYRPKLLPMISR